MSATEEKWCPCFKRGPSGSRCTECGDIFRVDGPPRRGLYIGIGVTAGFVINIFGLILLIGPLGMIILPIIGGFFRELGLEKEDQAILAMIHHDHC